MDKRILKTRQCLRDALLDLMKTKPYKKITVREICEKSNTGRVTFYNHYDDKYDLLLDCFDTMQKNATERFKVLQQQNNPDNLLVRNCENLIDAIYAETKKYSDISVTDDMDLMLIYYQMIIRDLEEMEDSLSDRVQIRFDRKQLNAFLALGFWGFLHGNNNRSDLETLHDAHRLVKDLVESHVFSER
jgi:AcrR family transcriptional regulator